MTVLLRTSTETVTEDWNFWVPVGPLTAPGPDPNKSPKDLASRLEAAVTEAAELWWDRAKSLAGQPGADLSHTIACAGNISDFGLMLGWTALVGEWAADERTILCLCDDPWLFRHLSGLPGVSAGTPPPLRRRELILAARGLLSRMATAIRMAGNALRCRKHRRRVAPRSRVLLVYGHPASREDGYDAYFGDLPRLDGDLTRVTHVDCPAGRAAVLGAGLHGWGNPLYALSLPFCRWKPDATAAPDMAWLIRRAAAQEGATGTPAMIRWQVHCQSRFLRQVRPKLVLWPWENHAWERALVTTARQLGCKTLGYQHATIGSLEINYAAFSHPDPKRILPDEIACAGHTSLERLSTWGIPSDRMWIGGAWRFPRPPALVVRADAPVFVALPANRDIAGQMLAAIAPLADKGWRFWVREHPMTPVGFKPGGQIETSPGPLSASAQVRAVLFAGSSVGLEGALAGVPVVRFLPEGTVANDVVPDEMKIPVAAKDQLEDCLRAGLLPQPYDFHDLFAEADGEIWRERMRFEK